jgi:hypothetical protein
MMTRLLADAQGWTDDLDEPNAWLHGSGTVWGLGLTDLVEEADAMVAAQAGDTVDVRGDAIDAVDVRGDGSRLAGLVEHHLAALERDGRFTHVDLDIDVSDVEPEPFAALGDDPLGTLAAHATADVLDAWSFGDADDRTANDDDADDANDDDAGADDTPAARLADPFDDDGSDDDGSDDGGPDDGGSDDGGSDDGGSAEDPAPEGAVDAAVHDVADVPDETTDVVSTTDADLIEDLPVDELPADDLPDDELPADDLSDDIAGTGDLAQPLRVAHHDPFDVVFEPDPAGIDTDDLDGTTGFADDRTAHLTDDGWTSSHDAFDVDLDPIEIDLSDDPPAPFDPTVDEPDDLGDEPDDLEDDL